MFLLERQFGFQHNHSTTHALLEITEKINQVCDSGKYICYVFLASENTFDSVNHNKPLEKLYHYEIRGMGNN